MPYKVKVETYAKLSDDTIGNVLQGNEFFYVDLPTKSVEEEINKVLALRKSPKIGVIVEMEYINGTLIKEIKN